METTRLSSKGQIIIPQSIRKAHHWTSGLEFAVIETKMGILLSPLKSIKQTSVQQILGCTGYKGPEKSLQDMKNGIMKGAKRKK